MAPNWNLGFLCIVCMLAVFTPKAVFSASTTGGLKQVVFMHGIFSAPSEWDYYESLVQKVKPGSPVTKVNMYNNAFSVAPMWEQVEQIGQSLNAILTDTSATTVLVCYSQGGVICRGLLSTIKHNVETWISLSSPLAGQYGDTQYLKYLFPHLLKSEAYRIFYTKTGQEISVGGYWNDPFHQDMYKANNVYLPRLNNVSSPVDPKSQEYKDNFLRLKNVVLVGGPDDGVITPWESSQFGYYDESMTSRPMEEQEWFKNDAFGLQTLANKSAVHVHTVPGVQHQKWHAMEDIFTKCIQPWL